MSKDNKKITLETFIEKSILKHNKKYNYSEVDYIDRETKVIITCNNCGESFKQRPRAHMHGQGCPHCSIYYRKKNNTENFIKECTKVHNGFYDYSITEYINSSTKINYICPIHGTIEQSPKKHKAGHSCFYCGEERKKYKNEIRRYENKPTTLYYIKINKKFYKIGLTQTSVSERYRQENIKYDIICEHYFENGLDALNIERKILNETFEIRNKENSPIKTGWSEIRSYDIFNVINKYLTNF